MVLNITKLEVTPFLQNTRIISAANGHEAVVIDPGGETDRILQALAKEKLKCTEIWLTHSHLDHCGGVRRLKEVTGAVLYAHPAEAAMRAMVEELAAMYGLPPGVMENCPEPDKPLTGGEVLEFAGEQFSVLFTPGHSPGHVCFYHQGSDTLIAGDTLFAGSIGRTDLPGGSHQQLLASIKEKILSLPGQTRVLSGHGPDTTVEREKTTNPFLTG
ncbi:MAG: MBL fold metallo-hydrolase [Candidatus Dadabacteria bacterium]|nr:MAG: MBL fold metallo-hydrolase [Candidatus Dadabacteria bacterium]